ncbi:MAG TPA: hypothetical protein VFS39_10875 [Nitrospira sp.]|nr:hypothetical protein [Nitrospira sp.]
MKRSASALLPAVPLLFTLSSTAFAESHSHPDLEKKAVLITRIALLPPQIDLFELGAGGGIEKMEVWSQTARLHTRHAIQQELAKREHLHLTELDERTLSDDTRLIYDESFLLYDATAAAILTHSFVNPNAYPDRERLFFPWKARDFTYSLGREVEAFASDADAFLL